LLTCIDVLSRYPWVVPLTDKTIKKKHFYLTLPSNSSMNYCPNNTLTLYTTIFSKITDLDETWEIGLAEIHYPHSWHSVKNNEAWLKVHFYNELELQKHLVLLPDGYYSSAKRIPHRGEKAHEGTQE
jgi:hypothetical protein